MNDILWLTMRRMRTPLIVMILIYTVSVQGMVLIPGQDADGNVIHVGYLDAAYFVSILAASIGFGEIPATFTGAQRLYVYLILIPNVVAWLYSFGAILGMFLDPQFRVVVRRSRFAGRVRSMHEPFFIVCGFGSTGHTVVGALQRRGFDVVVLERDETIVNGMVLSDSTASVPALAGDVADRRLLELAGLLRTNCLGVMALTNDDHVNLTVAITSKLLRPDIPVLARSETSVVTANMASFGTHTVDPYGIFAERFFLALSSPIKYLVQDWLISVPGSDLREPLDPPMGRWVVCGLGRFGTRIVQRLEEAALPCTVVDPSPERLQGRTDVVLGRATEETTLVQARIRDAVGVVAATPDDVDNLSIIMTARELNPRIFVVARQETQANEELFDASGAELVARRSIIVARRALMLATTPLLPVFLQHLINQNEAFAQRVASKLQNVLQRKAPAIWTVHLVDKAATGLHEARSSNVQVELRHILSNARTAEPEPLPCFCLLLERGASRTYLPEPDHDLHEGDRLLFAGRTIAQDEIHWLITEPYVLQSIASGRDVPRGVVWRWLTRRGKHRPKRPHALREEPAE